MTKSDSGYRCWHAAARGLLGGCAIAPEEDPVFIRLNELDQRVQRIERVLTNNSLLELAQRLDALQADVRSLRGEVEVLQNQSEGGKDAIARPVRRSREATGRAGNIGRCRCARVPAAGGRGAAGRSGAGGEQANYDAAFIALKGGKYPKAIASFKGFLATYPDRPLASNAQYWFGEAYYVTREYDERHQRVSQGARRTGRTRARRRTRW